jgi:hypothetical protein
MRPSRPTDVVSFSSLSPSYSGNEGDKEEKSARAAVPSGHRAQGAEVALSGTSSSWVHRCLQGTTMKKEVRPPPPLPSSFY